MLGTVNGYYGSYLIFFYSIFSQKKKKSNIQQRIR